MNDFKTLPIKDKPLFLRYAIPCGEVLVKRGELERQTLLSLNEATREKLEIDYPIEKIFPVASKMCTIIARQMGKREIDAEVIRRYFLIEHEKAIKWRQKVRPELKIEECLVYPARVLRIDDKNIFVKTPLGEKFLRPDFAKGIKVNDWVSVHYDYVVEKIKQNWIKRMRE